MKILKFKQALIKTIAGLITGILLIINVISCAAQKVWDSSKVKARTIYFECEKSNDKIYITNSKYEDPIKSRKQYDFEKSEYSYVRLVSQNSTLEVFRSAFDGGRISKLAKLKERILIFISVDEKGQLIYIGFSLDKGTTITPSEMEALENQMVNRIRFEIIGKRITNPIFYRVSLQVWFSEVEKGEIRTARNLENLKAPSVDN